jgi:hypothetical protein
MSYHVLVDDDYAGDVATIAGWKSLHEWSESISLQQFPQLCHLLDHGWSQHPATLLREISKALSSRSAKKAGDNAVLKALKKAVRNAGKDAQVVQISDGVGY